MENIKNIDLMQYDKNDLCDMVQNLVELIDTQDKLTKHQRIVIDLLQFRLFCGYTLPKN